MTGMTAAAAMTAPSDSGIRFASEMDCADCTVSVDQDDSGKPTMQYDWDELPALAISGTVSAAGAASVEVINMSEDQTATLMVAQYRGGQMIDVQYKTVYADGTFNIGGFSHKTGDIYRSFLLENSLKNPPVRSGVSAVYLRTQVCDPPRIPSPHLVRALWGRKSEKA